MIASQTQIRELAERVAATHGLEVVDLEFLGGSGPHRTLRVYLERNAAGRAALEERLRDLESGESVDGGAVGSEPDRAQDVARGDVRQDVQQDAQQSSGDGERQGGTVELDMVLAGEVAGLDEDEDELAYLRSLPRGIPAAQLSGVTHGDCERFSRDFGVALDVEDLVPGAEYLLEASSPGLDRKLTRPEEFERFAGQLCKLQTRTPVGGNRQLRGRLGPLRGGILELLPAEDRKPKRKKGGAAAPSEAVSVALDNIERAQLVPEF